MPDLLPLYACACENGGFSIFLIASSEKSICYFVSFQSIL